jgi:hypothetical protein
MQCGKSAAVFACAKEQGFNVIEVFFFWSMSTNIVITCLHLLVVKSFMFNGVTFLNYVDIKHGKLATCIADWSYFFGSFCHSKYALLLPEDLN